MIVRVVFVQSLEVVSVESVVHARKVLVPMITLRKSRIYALALLACALSAAMADRASAAFILDESGTVAFPKPNSTVEYAVYQNTSASDWTSAGGLLPSGLTAWNLEDPTRPPVALSGSGTTATYIYLYEVTDIASTPTSSIIELFQLQGSGLNGLSSFGFIAATSATGVGATGGVFGPSSTIVSGNGRTPDDAGMVVPGTLDFTFSLLHAIQLGGNSVILFLTSNDAPGVGLGTIHDTFPNNTSDRDLPIPTPLPAAFALLLSGLPVGLGLGLIKGRRRVSTKA